MFIWVRHLKSMIEIIRTNSENLEFKKLVQLLNSDLAKRDTIPRSV